MATNNIKKNTEGYGYKYTDIAEVHNYLESIGATYYQTVETVDGVDYIVTYPIIDGEEKPPRRGARIANATLSGKSNPAQEQGAAITYARRYSLLMAFGLATTDDDAACLTVTKFPTKDDKTKEEALAILKATADEYKVPIDAILKKGKVSSLEDMTIDRINNCIRWLNKGGDVK